MGIHKNPLTKNNDEHGTHEDSVPSVLVDALKFYAQGNHYFLADEDAWDTVSGEPLNFQHHHGDDGESVGFVEDGSVAIAALRQLKQTQSRKTETSKPVFMWHIGATEDESEVFDVDCACPCCIPLYTHPPHDEVLKLIEVSSKILKKLYSETESVTGLDTSELEEVLTACKQGDKS